VKAVICGAGIAGLTAAHELAELGWEVTLLEQAPAPRTQGYMIDFFGPGYDAAERMYVLPRLAEAGYRVDELRYHDDTGRTRARLSYRRITDALDGRVFSIMRPDLEAALREALPAGVRQLFGTSVRSVDDHGDGVEVTTTRGLVLGADLLVGADGVHSRVRRLVFGPERDHLRYLGFHTAAFTFRDAAVRDEIGDAVCLTESIDRQIGLYGLRDGRVAVFAVHREPDPALPDAPADTVRAAYAPLGWVTPRVLAHVPPDDELYYDQVAQIVMPSWRHGRVVLVGDAAYAVSLLAGQGASLAVAGAFVLAGCLRETTSVEQGLDEYERIFRPVAEEKQRVAVKAVRWFLPHTRTQLRIRRAALTLARIPVFTRYVAGAVTGKAANLLQASQREAA
jgi:2-polyprenyl-6-methoxyphenol hydroxylase-like FAD-dependent oxidoreductase